MSNNRLPPLRGWVPFRKWGTVGSSMPSIQRTGGGTMSRSGSTVTWTPFVYTPSDLDTNTTVFDLDGVPQADGVITFPYTLAPGHTLLARGMATKAGWISANPMSNLVANPAAIDIPNDEWSNTEAVADADTRKSFVQVLRDNRAGYELHAVRGSDASGLAIVSTTTPNLAYISAGSRLTPISAGLMTWQSGGLTPLGGMSHVRLVEVEIAVGYSSARWCSEVDTFQASDTPAIPTNVNIFTGSGEGLINVDVVDAGNARRRAISGMWATINGGTAFALSPTGGAAGLRVLTALGTSAVDISVFWRNANGDSAATAPVSVVPGVSVTLAPITMLNSIILSPSTSATFWDAPTGGNQVAVPVVYDALGKPSVIKQAGVYAEVSPASVGNANGLVRDPYKNTSVAEQGFDLRMETSSSIKSTVRVKHNPALNLETLGRRVSIADQATYIKHVPYGGFGDAGNTAEFGILTVLDTQPAEEFFRPATSRSSKIIRAKKADLSLGVLREFADVAGQLSLATIAGYIPDFRFSNGYGGEALRCVSNDRAGTGSTYMSTSGQTAAFAYLRMHIGPNDATKQAVALRMAQIGLDRYEDYLNGWRSGGGAGQFQKELECMVFAGFALNRPEILEAAKVVKQCIVSQTKFVPPEAEGYSPGWPTSGDAGTDQRRNNGGFTASHVGQPFLFQQGSVMNYASTMKLTQRYLPVSSPVSVMGLFFILALRNGPGGISGLDWWLSAGNGVMDVTNDRAAGVWWLDRYMNGWSDTTIPAWVRLVYAANRGAVAAPIYSGPGLTYERTSPGAGTDLTATATGFNFNWAGKNWSTGVLQKVQTRFSQRGKQFIEVPATAGVDDTGSVTQSAPATGALVPVKHYVQMRYQNLAPNGSLYWSDWSPNYSYSDLAGFAGERDVITPVSPAITAAPVFTVAPKMLIQEFPRTTEPSYLEVSGVLDPKNVVLVVGEGYCRCAAGATVEYQLIIDGVPYGARQSSQIFSRPRTLAAGTPFIGRTFVNDGTNAEVSADTNVLSYAAAAVLPANVIFKSDFAGGFDFEWPGVRDSMTGVGNNTQAAQWQPYLGSPISPPGDLEITAADVLQTSSGLIRVFKSNQYPSLSFEFSRDRPLIVGRKYRITLDIPIGVYNDVTAPMFLQIGSAVLGSDYVSGTVIDPYPQPRVFRKIVEFTATAANGWCRLYINTANGGAVGGDPTISEMLVEEITDFSTNIYPTPYAVPVVAYDSAVSGLLLGDFTYGAGTVVTHDGTGLLFGAGTAWGQIIKELFHPAMEIGREVRVTMNTQRVSGSFTGSQGIGRPLFIDPDYGSIPASGTLYKADLLRPNAVTTTVDVVRLQSVAAIRTYLQNRDNSGGFRLNSLKIEVL